MTCGKKILIVLAAALAVVGPAYAITGGTPDGQGHPAVGLMLADAGPAGFQPDCSGALIAPDVYVTAAHCFIGTASNRVLITFDTQASASSKFVSWGMVVYDSSMLRAIVCRMRYIFSSRTPPKSSVSGEPGGVTPRGDAAATCSLVSRM